MVDPVILSDEYITFIYPKYYEKFRKKYLRC